MRFRYGYGFETAESARVRGLLEKLRRQDAARPARPIFAVRIEASKEPKRHALLCVDCYREIEEPTRVYVLEPAPWALRCDWCKCRNVQTDPPTARPTDSGAEAA
jgi:hypothetical protein